MRFDPLEFESLTGLDAFSYAVDLERNGSISDEVIYYFESRAAALDLPHLEVALYLVVKSSNPNRFQIISAYLLHPDFNIRFIPVKVVGEMKEVDAVVMGNVVAALCKFANDDLTRELLCVLRRPKDDDAKRVVDNYLQGLSL